MEQNYIDIQARVQSARQQRSQALGNLISAGCKGLLSSIARMQHRDEPRKFRSVNPSDFIRFQCLP